VLLIEQWGMRPLAALVARFAHWPPVARLEAWLRRAPPRLALALFLVPALLLVPIKLAALWFIERGHVGEGIAVIVVAKLVGTALVGRLFVVVEPQLMQFGWFARAVERWRATKQRLKAWLDRSAAWRAMRRGVGHVGRWLKSLLR